MGSRCLHSAGSGSWLAREGREKLCPHPPSSRDASLVFTLTPLHTVLPCSFSHHHPQLCHQYFHLHRTDSAPSLFPLDGCQSTGELGQESPQKCRVGQRKPPPSSQSLSEDRSWCTAFKKHISGAVEDMSPPELVEKGDLWDRHAEITERTMHCRQLFRMEPAPCRTKVWDGNPHAQGSPSCLSNAPTFSLTQLCSPGGSCCPSSSQQRVTKELNLGRKQIKICFLLPPAPTHLKTKAPFSEAAQTSSALDLLCLRDQGWQGTAFIRQLYLVLCRRETVQTSGCY